MGEAKGLTAQQLQDQVYQRDLQEHPESVRYVAMVVVADLQGEQSQLRRQINQLVHQD